MKTFRFGFFPDTKPRKRHHKEKNKNKTPLSLIDIDRKSLHKISKQNLATYEKDDTVINWKLSKNTRLNIHKEISIIY